MYISATHVDIWSVDISKITSWFKNYRSTSIVTLLDQRKYNTHVDIWSVDISKITSWFKNYQSTSIVKLLDQRNVGQVLPDKYLKQVQLTEKPVQTKRRK